MATPKFTRTHPDDGILTRGGTITPHDTNNVSSDGSVFVYVGTSGHLTVDTAGGDTDVQYKNVPVGWFPVLVDKVKTATTASDLRWGR